MKSSLVVLRDAKDQLAHLRPDEIDEMEVSLLSLMPEGLTKSLRRDELVDLVRFLSALGREDELRMTVVSVERGAWGSSAADAPEC